MKKVSSNPQGQVVGEYLPRMRFPEALKIYGDLAGSERLFGAYRARLSNVWARQAVFLQIPLPKTENRQQK